MSQCPDEQQGPVAAADDVGRAMRAGLQIEIVGPDSASVGVAGRLQTQLARGIDVAEEVLQHAAVDDDGAPGGDALGVERPAADPAGHQSVVDDRDLVVAYFLAELVGQERRPLVDGRSRDAAEEKPEQAPGHKRLEDDGNPLGSDLARVELAHGAGDRRPGHLLGAFQVTEMDLARIPEILDHVVRVAALQPDAQAGVGFLISSGETARGGQHRADLVGAEAGPVRIGDALVGQGDPLGLQGQADLGAGFESRDLGIINI